MKKRNQMTDTVKLFKIFSDETRLKIIALLCESTYCVQDISNELKMSQSSISHQLKLLRDMNVVKTKREGKNIYYSLKDNHIKEIYLMGVAHANEC
ncbi:MAG: ArsR/SmtB family transcription factor [Candidatus Izemoplasmataceae bacterium]